MPKGGAVVGGAVVGVGDGDELRRRGSKHKRHTTADGKIFYEDLNNPGVTTWVLPEDGVVVEEGVDTSGGSGDPGGSGGGSGEKSTKKRKGQLKKSGRKEKQKPNRRQTRHRRIDTADGLTYFDNVDHPGETSWTLPENGVVVNETNGSSGGGGGGGGGGAEGGGAQSGGRNRAVSRHKRMTTARGELYYVNIDQPAETSWSLPDGGILITDGEEMNILEL